MVLKTTLCRFSGLRIYPGKGILFVRIDSQQYLFLNKKCKALYNNRLRPAKLAWTAQYRKAHKKDQVNDTQRKKRRALGRSAVRSIAGATIELINKRRTEKPEVRQATRDAALREIKERNKKTAAVKATKTTQPKAAHQQKVAAVGRGKGAGGKGAGGR
mmetsp:Transcript_16451/g.28193  ORF Transcript_16451/g.28193 Transcript_16451/m.28193 type:complete len:159 (+) Transcript_16451:52-528(+)|eukprot:CAMPEP_0119104356 /NCGR_PEP_ID=MMETSP1180-20130426/2570_1 /TAXON_ID=3052 ORGANISM="Chlamydomonas cf sp, Strain CCMP681" /NCGR_SAMPLE_ID=MMETSP1180 /ASSEMBLY_ACC=CAM_ASM_000741 /LENGTH=158 /DNA_ID=CAMNT_0007089083 /DNA_START=55 /DNA_END=531 /DNA_ORIENTATION=-